MTFDAEQYCKIVAIALEDPAESQRPISEWTPREIADEAVRRGIVNSISKSQVRLFLKGERRKAAQNGRLA
jgi:putative transposase